MELLVHGTKQGYKSSLIPNVQAAFSIGDIRNGVNDEKCLGKSLYSLAFLKGGCVFTKYTILRDTLRAYATGNIAFSLFLSADSELSGKGAAVKSLLDKLSSYYIDKYVRDNNINKGETRLIQEDWSFLSTISNDFKELKKSRKEEEVIPGIADPAYHYYRTDIELIEHLDKPFQEEYNGYRQILFIDSSLKGVANPLSILKNSGVELNPDLQNEYFYLNNDNINKKISIIAKGKPRSGKKGENQIRAKWQIEIKYSKDVKCYEPINVCGTISDLSSEIHKYLEIKGNQIMLKYDAFNNPPKREKSIAFEIKDQKGENIEGAKIYINGHENVLVNNTITFKGEDIIKDQEVYASKESEHFYSEHVIVKPNDQNNTVVLTLQKRKVVKIIAIDKENGNNIVNFKIKCDNRSRYFEYGTEIVFENDDINKYWKIEVFKKDGQDTYSGSFDNYYPATGDKRLFVDCKKTITISAGIKQYKIYTGEHGKKSKYCPDHSNSNTGNDIDKKHIIVKKGHSFKNWKLENDTLVAQNEKKKYFTKSSKLIVASIIGVLFFGFGVFAICNFLGKCKQTKGAPLTTQKITNYVEGDTICIDTLNKYKADWKSQEEDFISKSRVGFFGGEKIIDSTNWKNEWKPVYESIEKAIKKRYLINYKIFEELKNLHYSYGQDAFKSAIFRIDTTQYDDVYEELGDVSYLTLNQIALRINHYLNSKDPVKMDENNTKKRNEHETEDSKSTPAATKHNNEESRPQPQLITNELNRKIIDYLKGSELAKDKLKYYKANAGINPEIIKCIELCLRLWSLTGERDNSYYWMKTQIDNEDKYSILKNSELYSFLVELDQSQSPKYWNEIRGNISMDKTLGNLKSNQ